MNTVLTGDSGVLLSCLAMAKDDFAVSKQSSGAFCPEDGTPSRTLLEAARTATFELSPLRELFVSADSMLSSQSRKSLISIPLAASPLEYCGYSIDYSWNKLVRI